MNSNRINRQFVINRRPQGMVEETDLRLESTEAPTPGQGQVLIKTTYISLDPSMRGQMENRADYAAPLQIGDVMRAGGVGEIVESQHPDYEVGAQVSGTFGMQDYVVSDGRNLPFEVFPADIDPQQMLGALGGTGLTAYFGLLDLGAPKAGDTVVVSGAAGATGSVAGQIARIKDCRVIGIAGGSDKCSWLTEELGFDAAIDYKNENVGEALDRLCPDGINVFFDNVGGEILDDALARIAMNARVVICGGISRYNKTGEIPGPKNYFNLVYRRARMEGFIVIDYYKRFAEARQQLKAWLDEGRIVQRATVIDGFENLPKALVSLFQGVNTGKLMVRT